MGATANVLYVCLGSLALYLVSRLVSKRNTPLPPGPPGWPLIGNLLDFPTYAPYRTFAALSGKYGPVMSFNVMGAHYVVLNSVKAIKDLLDKNSAVTSNRLQLTMGGELVGWKDSTVFLQYGDTYRKHRKFFHQQIGTKSSLEAFYSAEEEEARRLVRNVLKDPDNVIAHCCSVQDDDDPLVKMVDNAMNVFYTIMKPGRFLVDTLPILRYLPEWFPGGGFHKDAKRWRKIVRETADTPHQLVLEHLAKGDALPSLTSQLLQEGVTPEEEEILKYGFKTPYAIAAFFLAMAIYPEVLKKAQAEVDVVVGDKRLPTMEDRDALPWNVLVSMPLHVTTEDIIYEGYLIPKGTCLLGNIWFILTNPEIYPDPDVFDPERFLGENQQLDPREMCFGWGRRSCPGSLLAESTIFICVVMALATLDISRCVENGVKVVPTFDVKEDVVRLDTVVVPVPPAIRGRLDVMGQKVDKRLYLLLDVHFCYVYDLDELGNSRVIERPIIPC
ncbi:cytochrome P450 [Boletus coccyginus]|nr:cytochrome P450 [Boletus coccyginus]